jgi:hypothetical protein
MPSANENGCEVLTVLAFLLTQNLLLALDLLRLLHPRALPLAADVPTSASRSPALHVDCSPDALPACLQLLPSSGLRAPPEPDAPLLARLDTHTRAPWPAVLAVDPLASSDAPLSESELRQLRRALFGVAFGPTACATTRPPAARPLSPRPGSDLPGRGAVPPARHTPLLLLLRCLPPSPPRGHDIRVDHPRARALEEQAERAAREDGPRPHPRVGGEVGVEDWQSFPWTLRPETLGALSPAEVDASVTLILMRSHRSTREVREPGKAVPRFAPPPARQLSTCFLPAGRP